MSEAEPFGLPTTSPSDRLALEITALRRNSPAAAERLRRDVPLLLARLAAEVSGAVIELQLATQKDGVVRTELVIDAGESTDDLRREAATVLTPVAELADVDEVSTARDWTVWPLTCSPRAPLGFGAEESFAPIAVRWGAESADADLLALLCTHPGAGLRLRLRACDTVESSSPQWSVDAAVLTAEAAPSLRLRAQIRAQFPGLQVARDVTDEPTILQVGSDYLPQLFAVPVGGQKAFAGICLGSAAPLPAPVLRGALPTHQVVKLGSSVTAAGRTVPVLLGQQERLRHTHVVGRTGTGKSSCLAGVMHEIACGEDGLLLLDPHGHLVDRVVAELPSRAAGRTWVVRCGDVDNPVPMNPLAIEDPTRREIAIADVCEIFQHLFDKKNTGIVGPRFRERVAMGLRALTAVFGDRASLLDVPAALASADFVSRAVALTKDDRLKAWLANDIKHRRSGEYGDLVSWVNSKFEAFSGTAAMRAILGSGANAIDMTDAMDTGRIILVDLSKSSLGESATALLGFLYLNQVWTSALQRRDTARPFTVVVDEAQAMVSGSLTTMLSEGRKFGLAVVMAHQYLGQLDDDLRPAVDGNVATTVAFRAAVGDLPALRQRFGDRVDASTLMTLPDLSAVVMRTASNVAADPHTLIIDHNERVGARSGTYREEFDAEIARASCRDLVDPFREDTRDAAEGRSATLQIAAKKPNPPKPAKPAATPTPGLNFLDEWLATRAKGAATVAESPQKSDNDAEAPQSA